MLARAHSHPRRPAHIWRRLVITASALSLAIDLGASLTWAGGLVTEWGGGMGLAWSASALLNAPGAGVGSRLGPGLSAQLGFFADLQTNASKLATELGLQHRLTTQSSGGLNVQLHATYASVRAGLGRTYLGLGYSPFVLAKTGASGASLSRVSGGSGILVEAGWRSPITPEAALVLSISSEWISSPAGSSPAPLVSLMAALRIYLFGQKAGAKARSGGETPEYRPWRYPKGYMLN